MRQLILSVLFIALYLSVQSQASNSIIIGNIDSLHSNILGEQRKVWVYVPNNSDQDIYSKQNYPVVYLLDGPGHFVSVVGMIQQLSA